MKVGVGVITMGLRPIQDYRLAPGSDFFLYVDHDQKGPAHARNQVLKHFYDGGYDVFFVFDDDCYPLADGWERYFIDQYQGTGIHFFGLPDSLNAGVNACQGEIIYWNGVLGCFGMFTPALIEAVGYYNTAYTRYGHEDNGYTFRALRSGLAGDKSGFPSPIRTAAYIYSTDVYGQTVIQNLSQEEKDAFIELNRPIFDAEINGEQIYYPFDQEGQ